LSLVTITYRPLKEMIISEITEYASPEALAQNFAYAIRGGQPAALAWAEDLVFYVLPIPPVSDLMIKEYLEGRAHYGSVMFAPMSPYRPVIRVNALEIPVIDASATESARALATWLKGRKAPSARHIT
jgi:hypothetical protein